MRHFFKKKVICFRFLRKDILYNDQTFFPGSSKAMVKLEEAIEAERMVSVRPSLNIRREALSYVEQDLWWSLQRDMETERES